MIRLHYCTLISIQIRILLLLNLILSHSLWQINWLAKSLSFSWWDTISILRRHRNRCLLRSNKVLTQFWRVWLHRYLFLLFFLSRSLLYHIIDDFLLSSFFIFLNNFLFNSFPLIFFPSLLILLLLIKIKVSRLKSLITYHIFLNDLIRPDSLLTYCRFLISWKISLVDLVIIQSCWRAHLLLPHISWIRAIQLISRVNRRLSLVPMTLMQVYLLPSRSFLQIRINLSPVVQKDLLNMIWISNPVLHVQLILALKSLWIPFWIGAEQPCVRIIVLVRDHIVSFRRMGVWGSSLQETYPGVLFVKILLILYEIGLPFKLC